MITHLDIIQLSHYDLGFTDHPLVCRQLHVRYLERALELLDGNPARPPERRFYWTCEANNALADWWPAAAPERRAALLAAARAGWLEVSAAPFNHVPTLDARQWRCCARWLPDDLRGQLRLRTIVQDDVNGMPRAGAMALMDAGAEFLWMAMNPDTGATPLPQPGAFWWEMPDGRRLLVMNTITYPNGYFLFEATEWRRGPLPQVSDTRYRPPAPNDFFRTAPEDLARAHALCLAQLEKWQNQGCRLGRVPVSLTNMWRCDNDPPCELLVDFIAAWNKAGLQPALRLTTPARALEELRREEGDRLPTLRGEWVDWWANGVASTPRELAASRRAKRCLDALDSSLYPKSPAREQRLECCVRDLCLFDEHTWGAWNSAARPDCPESKAQAAEKTLFAYRPLALAELEIGELNRAIAPAAPGVHVINPYPAPFSGWIELPCDCLRGDYAGVADAASGAEQRFDVLPGPMPFYLVPDKEEQFSPFDKARVFPDNVPGRRLRFWVENLAPHQVRSFRLVARVRATAAAPGAPEIRTDAQGWPVFARWAGTVLFDAPPGDFFSLEFQRPFPRWDYKRVMNLPTFEQRRAEREAGSGIVMAQPAGAAALRDTGPTLVYEQYLQHHRLGRARRILEVFKGVPRARLTVTIDRLSKPESCEIFYVRFPLMRQEVGAMAKSMPGSSGEEERGNPPPTPPRRGEKNNSPPAEGGRVGSNHIPSLEGSGVGSGPFPSQEGFGVGNSVHIPSPEGAGVGSNHIPSLEGLGVGNSVHIPSLEGRGPPATLGVALRAGVGSDSEFMVTNGGVAYRPGRDQLPNTCQDFHAIDGRVYWNNGTTGCCLETFDAALVEIGGLHDALRIPALPPDAGAVYAVIYNNIWYTNFPGDENGIMDFEFELAAAAGPQLQFSPQAFAVVRV